MGELNSAILAGLRSTSLAWGSSVIDKPIGLMRKSVSNSAALACSRCVARSRCCSAASMALRSMEISKTVVSSSRKLAALPCERMLKGLMMRVATIRDSRSPAKRDTMPVPAIETKAISLL